MSYHPPPIVDVVHAIPGRVRLRLFWLHDHPEAAPRVVETLRAEPGVDAVQVRRFTGSVLVEYDPDRVDVEGIIERLQHCVGGIIHRPGEERPDEVLALEREAYEEGADLARSAAELLKGVDAQVLRFTEGRADAATLAAVGFIVAGAVEVVSSGELPMPPWFQLAWWAFRTFATLEERAIENTEHPFQRVTH